MSKQADASWKRHFPTRSDDDRYVNRRELTKVLGLTSLGFLFATFAAAARRLWRNEAMTRTVRIPVAAVDDVAVGSYKLFQSPEGDPYILLRVGPERFSAFNQRCTHLSCPVYLNAEKMQLACPCHSGFFSVYDGQPIAGPANRPLASVTVAIKESRVWAEFSNEQNI
jgi:Rieske Fe-S protein